MSVSVTMPRLGESVSEGTVTRWLKKEGDRVEADEPLLEVSTDKVDTEIPAPAAGVLSAIRVGEDETVEVGAELAVIDDGGGAAGGGEQQAAAAPAEAPPAEAQDQPAAPQAGDDGGGGQAGGGQAGGGTVPVLLPALGESVSEGTVTRWLKQEGDTVKADEPLLEVSTDKVDTEIPAPAAGVLSAIKVREDETVAVGTELAVISSGDGAAAAPAAQQAPAQAAPQAPAQAPAQRQSAPSAPAPRASAPPAGPPAAERSTGAAPTSAAQPPAAPAPAVGAPPTTDGRGPAGAEPGGAYVTPLVRKLAAEHDVDLASVSGTGVGGRIRKQDVLEAAKAQEAARAQQAQQAAAQQPATAQPAPAADRPAAVSPLRGRTEKMSRMRAVIARRMVESLQVSAQLTTVVEADVTNIARLRARAKADFEARESAKLSFLPFFALATVEALKQHPVVNASIDTDAGTITYYDAEHLGIAVDTDRGLMVPVIHNAGDLNLGGLARKIADLAERTRSNKVSPDELGGGTFTLTNTGSRGALIDTPIINQPQVGILGTGTVVKRPVVVSHPELGETIAIRSMVYLALSYDHRLVDGADAARFLTTIKNRLEEGKFQSEVGLA